MSGGKFDQVRTGGARAAGMSLGCIALLLSGTAAFAGARPVDDDANQRAEQAVDGPVASEKSVLVAADACVLDAGRSVADVTVADSEVFEPIPVASDHEPDLADPPAGPPTPTLADEYVAFNAADLAAETPDFAAERANNDESANDDELADADDAAPAIVDKGDLMRPQTASFYGITPGESTRADVARVFGKPVAVDRTGAERYQLEGFPSIVVRLSGDLVETIRIQLFEPVSCAQLAAKLDMKALRSVSTPDAAGRLSASVFPERGVTFNHRPVVGAALATDGDKPEKTAVADAVYEIVVEPINSAAFLLRAQSTPAREYIRCVTDLEIALALDERNEAALVMLSQLKLSMGDAVEAEQLAAEVVKLDPHNDAYRIQWAKALKYLARYDQAVEQARTVIEGTTATPLERAQALVQMGSLAALGPQAVHERTIPLFNKAIALADPLAASDDPATAAAAGQLLVIAHLAIAEEIAAGRYQQKEEMVAKWIARASGLAEHLIESGAVDLSLRLEVAVSALAATSRIETPINPALWVKEAEQAAAGLQMESVDLPVRDQLNWQLGLVYYYAAEISHRRSQPDEAIKYGQLAEATLVPAADARRDLPDTEYVLGRLYFQIGAVHAVHFRDHEEACQWYDRAVDLLLKPVPLTAQTSPAKHGDALVSMGVSYWQRGQRKRAYELTSSGKDLVQQGVSEGLLAEDSLHVALNNLAAMDRALGRAAEAVASDSADDDSTDESVKLATKSSTAVAAKNNAGAAVQPRGKSQVAAAQVAQARQPNGKRNAGGQPRTQTADRRATESDNGARRR